MSTKGYSYTNCYGNKKHDEYYTYDNVYNAIKNWCINKYHLQGYKIIRPFYQSNDYKNFDYSGKVIVIDNPPFSCLGEIIRYYKQNKIHYFLFAPHLSLFSGSHKGYIATNNEILYKNGRKIRTSFVTDLIKSTLRTEPELREIIEKENSKNIQVKETALPYDYISASLLSPLVCSHKIESFSNEYLHHSSTSKYKFFGSAYKLEPEVAKQIRELRGEYTPW